MSEDDTREVDKLCVKHGYKAPAGGFDIPEGWLKLVDKLMGDLRAAGWEGQIMQVKDKFGGLRFYVDSADEEHYVLINTAEAASFHACEDCGEPAKCLRVGNWYRTLCNAHLEEVLRKHGEYLDTLKEHKPAAKPQ